MPRNSNLAGSPFAHLFPAVNKNFGYRFGRVVKAVSGETSRYHGNSRIDW